jgi:hypothetical protein
MDRSTLFGMSLLTVIMVSAGVRECRNNPGLAVLMIAIPVCGWIALIWGK